MNDHVARTVKQIKYLRVWPKEIIKGITPDPL